MNRLILIGILWCLVIAIGRAQEAAKFIEASQTPTLEIEPPSSLPASEPTPVNGQSSPYRPSKSEPPRRVAEPKRIVVQPGVDAQESEVAMQFMADLEKAGIAKIDKTEMTPTSDSPIVVQFFMRENESFEKIKQFIVVLRHSGLEHMVLEYGGIHPEGRGEPENGLVFRTILGFSPDELQKLELAARKAAADCGLSLHFSGTLVAPSGSASVGPPDKAASPSYAPSFRPAVPQLQTDYEAANKQAHDLAESLRQTPDAAKKAELRTAVQRAFTLRQSLLRAELQEMQARLEKTQQSLDMRDRSADQIVDRRVEDLLNPQLKWDDDRPIESTPPITSKATTPSMIEPAGPVSELEGDWHLVTYFDQKGEQREMSPTNWTFRGDQRSIVWPGGGYDCRIKVDPIKKTLWSYSKKEDGSFGQDYYELKGNQLILRNEPGAVGYQVFERGLVRIPSAVPPATPEQKLLWRSAIVEIVVFSMNSQAPRERVIGRGVVISSDGKILSQMSVDENGDLAKEKIKARFDDGTVIPLKLIEEAGQGWSVLLPELPIRDNHYFELSTSEVQLQDEVRVWRPEDSPFLSESLAPFGNTVTALDRKYPPLGIAVWQLRFSRRAVLGTPILDADGDLLGITITGAQDLLLAIPVAELRAMFPKSLGLLKDAEKAAEFPTIP